MRGFDYQFLGKCEDCQGELWTGIVHEQHLTREDAITLGEECDSPWMPYKGVCSPMKYCKCADPFPKNGTISLHAVYHWTDDEGQGAYIGEKQ